MRAPDTIIVGMADARFPSSLGQFLSNGVREIDLSCNQAIGGVEGGLCNVKAQFAQVAQTEIGKKLTEETLTSWLLSKQLRAAGVDVELERHYPGSREECDLVIEGDQDRRFWIEVKYGSKRWYRRDGSTGRTSAYKGYLLGDASHPGTAHDFRKLVRLKSTDAFGIGVLLIGFDSTIAQMDADIDRLTSQERLTEEGWSLATHERWLDRRNDTFRINCWFWCRKV
ncbi:MAG: hypothetical protein JWN24_1953 [Phycisphaerales bacterium]|nr:hypothetical protein [Phycisphaerales bacterium]